jgi:hypothetical protein
VSDQPVIYLRDDTDAQRLTASAGARRSLPGCEWATAAWYDWGRRLWTWVLTRTIDWDRLAGTLVRKQVELLHKESSSGRHRFHPDVLGQIDQLALEVSRRLMASELRSRHGACSPYGNGEGVSVADSPELVARLSVRAVRVMIEAAVEQWQQIANDPVMLHEWIDLERRNGESRALVVQPRPAGCAPASTRPPTGLEPCTPRRTRSTQSTRTLRGSRTTGRTTSVWE